MTKVFCATCKHLEEPTPVNDGVGITYTDYRCAHTSNITKEDCWMCENGKTIYNQKPQVLNANNACANYEVKT